MSSPLKALSLGLVAALAALAGLVAAHFYFEPGQPRGQELASGTLLKQPRAIPDFTLTGVDGQPLRKDALRDHWTAIFVGFTHCPDICPSTMGLLKTAHAQLAAQNRALQVLLLSVDPERDTPEALGRYVHHFNPAFLGATGPTAELDRLGSAMGFVYMKAPGATPETYTIDHSSALILVNPQAEVAGYFTAPLRLDALVGDLSTLIPEQAS